MILVSISILLLIFILNIVPAFMPPTWTLLSFVGLTFHFNNYALALFSIFAAVAATSGRAILALFSDKIIRNKFLNNKTKENIDLIKIYIEKRKIFLFSFFLFFAFSPFPSGQLFLAYGLTDLKLRFAVIPFFIGRLGSYLFWSLTASEISHKLVVSDLKSGAFFSLYFILTQLTTFYLVYLFIKIDWKTVFKEHKIRFIKKIIEQ